MTEQPVGTEQQPAGGDSTAADGASQPAPGRRARRAPGPPMTYVPDDRPEGGRRRARVPGEPAPDEQPAEPEPGPAPEPSATPATWATGAATAAQLSGGSAVDEGYAAARAARRQQTPSARVSVPTDYSDLRPHPVPRELLEPPPPVEPSPAEAAPTEELPAEVTAAPTGPVQPAEAPPAIAPPPPPTVVAPAGPTLSEQTLSSPGELGEEPTTDDVNLDRVETGMWSRIAHRLTLLLSALVIAGAVAAGTQIAAAQDWISDTGQLPRFGALVATWAAISLLTRRCGGRVVVIGAFTAALAVVVAAFPEEWALAGAATAAAVTFGLLGMVLTRPQSGVRTLGELLFSAFIGLVGAVVVSGYDVVLRPYRFRILVLSLVLVAALALAWRLGHGRRSIGRRGAVVLIFGVVALVASIAYAQAIRSWGSPGLVENFRDIDRWLSDTFGASPWPVEALVGFPLLVWGVAFRRRNRQGWWMCAFGALGAAGLTTSLIQTVTLGESLASTAYSVLIGAVIGGIAIAADRVLTGGGGRKADASAAARAERQEPTRFAPLL